MIFKVLIVGLGKIGLQYDFGQDPNKFIQTHSSAFNHHPGFELIGGVDIDKENRALFSKKFKAPAFVSLEEALRKINFDILVIATPSDSHLTLIELALTFAKPKLILCEKPLSLLSQDAKKIVELCSKTNVPLYVNYIRRADPAVIEIKRRLDAGEIQGPFKGTIYYTKGFIHNASHFFDLARFWFGPMTEFNLFNQKQIAHHDKIIDCNLKFINASMNFINVEDNDLSYWRVEFFSVNGKLTYSSDKNHISWEEKSPNNIHGNNFKEFLSAEIIETKRTHYQLNVTHELFSRLNGGVISLPTGRESLEMHFEIDKFMGVGC